MEKVLIQSSIISLQKKQRDTFVLDTDKSLIMLKGQPFAVIDRRVLFYFFLRFFGLEALVFFPGFIFSLLRIVLGI